MTAAKELEKRASLIMDVKVAGFEIRKDKMVAKIKDPLIPKEVMAPETNEAIAN